MEYTIETMVVGHPRDGCNCEACKATRSACARELGDWAVDFNRPCVKFLAPRPSTPPMPIELTSRELYYSLKCDCKNCKLTKDCITRANELQCIQIVNFSRKCLKTGDPQNKFMPKFYRCLESYLPSRKWKIDKQCSYCMDRKTFIFRCREAGDYWAADNTRPCYVCHLLYEPL